MHRDVAAPLDFLLGHRPADQDLGEVDVDERLAGAHDHLRHGAVVAVEDPLHLRRRATGAEPGVDQRHRRRQALDRLAVLDGEPRPLDQVDERRARREADRAEALHEDRPRPQRSDRVAQRRVEAADERGHADDRGDADDHAEDGQRRAHLVGPQRVEGHLRRLAEERQALQQGDRSFAPQRLDRRQHGGAAGRVPAEEQADGGGHQDADRHRPGFDRRRQRGERGEDPGEDRAQGDADDAARSPTA